MVMDAKERIDWFEAEHMDGIDGLFALGMSYEQIADRIGVGFQDLLDWLECRYYQKFPYHHHSRIFTRTGDG
jgi:hypothetical protein